MSSWLGILSGYMVSAIIFLLWRLAIGKEKKTAVILAHTQKEILVLAKEKKILEERLHQEVIRYDTVIAKQEETQAHIDTVDNTDPNELLDFMRN